MSFPSNPTDGQQYRSPNGVVYQWSASRSAWEVINDAVKALNLWGNRNVLINGDMRIWQRGTNFSSTGYTADRWRLYETGPQVTLSQGSLDGPNSNLLNHLHIDITTAKDPLSSGDNLGVYQRLEGMNGRRLRHRNITLSFWVRSNKTGIFSVGFRNGNGTDASYVTEYTINSPDVWEYKTVTIYFDDSIGSWSWGQNSNLDVIFSIATGSTYKTSTLNQWISGNYHSSSSVVNVGDSTSNYFDITGVQLEVGEEATEFEHLDYAIEMKQCERYYEIGQFLWDAVKFSATSTTFMRRAFVIFRSYKPSTPTISLGNFSYSNATNCTTSTITDKNFSIEWDATSGTNHFVRFNYTADAEL